LHAKVVTFKKPDPCRKIGDMTDDDRALDFDTECIAIST
jgi:hypothetical protein